MTSEEFSPHAFLAEQAGKESQRIMELIDSKFEQFGYERELVRQDFEVAIIYSYRKRGSFANVEYVSREHPVFGMGWFPAGVSFNVIDSDIEVVNFVMEIIAKFEKPVDLNERLRLTCEGAALDALEKYKISETDMHVLNIARANKHLIEFQGVYLANEFLATQEKIRKGRKHDDET